ncbi:MAG TPA: hypothetical protein VM536_06600, partial [Chloroflexia bacterium]|nr:hypothetical protein [Chloroflexia bacterium]
MSQRQRQLGLEPPPNCQRWPHRGGVAEAEVSAIVSGLLASVSKLSLDLRPAGLDDLDVLPAPLRYIGRGPRAGSPTSTGFPAGFWADL